jgi:hypothetical protein
MQTKRRERSAMNPSTGRASLFAVAGGYVIYLAYELLKNLIDNVPTTMPRWLQIFVIILFAGAGGALLVFAWRVWKKGREDQDENPVDLEAQEDSAKSEENGSEK